jgi:hypothetical protein
LQGKSNALGHLIELKRLIILNGTKLSKTFTVGDGNACGFARGDSRRTACKAAACDGFGLPKNKDWKADWVTKKARDKKPRAFEFLFSRMSSSRNRVPFRGHALNRDQETMAPGPGTAPGGHLPRMIMPSTSSLVTSCVRAWPTTRPFFITETRSARSNTS